MDPSPPAGPPTSATRVVVFVGGDPAAGDAVEAIPDDAFVIAADSGVEQAQALGRPIDLAVGDFDSVDPAALLAAEGAGTRVERHRPDKDATDLELALGAAAALGPDEIVVVGGAGGRLDHLLGGVLALTDPAYESIAVRALVGPARLFVIRDHMVVGGRPGELLTLLPIGGPAHGVTTSGLRYPLTDETLEPASTRGVSNVLLADHATVGLTRGVLLAVLPGELDPHPPASPAGERP